MPCMTHRFCMYKFLNPALLTIKNNKSFIIYGWNCRTSIFVRSIKKNILGKKTLTYCYNISEENFFILVHTHDDTPSKINIIELNEKEYKKK